MSKVISRPTPDKKRLRRTMMFMNAQKPGLIKDAYIYGSDSIILDLEDAVAENQKDAARFSLYHALKSIDPTGRRTSVSVLPAALTASVLPSAKTPIWFVRWKLPSRPPRRNSAWKWAAPC